MKSVSHPQKQKVDSQDLERKVKKMYRDVALHPEVSYHFEMGRDLALRLGYPEEKLKQIPSPAIDSFAGVGYYFDLPQIKKGESVVDLGSGSGMDTFFAALQVGEKGRVIGIDMTDEQLEKADSLKGEKFPQVSFRKGYIESPPIDSGIADVVISNGVINLSGDKETTFKAAATILKSGGRLAIADIVSRVMLPENISCNATLWAACIGGAMQRDMYLGIIEIAGFNIVQVKENPYQFISKSAKGATDQFGIHSISVLAVKK